MIYNSRKAVRGQHSLDLWSSGVLDLVCTGFDVLLRVVVIFLLISASAASLLLALADVCRCTAASQFASQTNC